MLAPGTRAVTESARDGHSDSAAAESQSTVTRVLGCSFWRPVTGMVEAGPGWRGVNGVGGGRARARACAEGRA